MKSIEKYGFEAFDIIKIFDIAFSKEELNIKEKHYIKQFNSFNNGYNFTIGGDGCEGRSPWNKGKKDVISEETRNKMREKAKGRKGYWEGVKGFKNPNTSSVICLTTKRIFLTVLEASEYYNIEKTNISKCINGKRNYCGKLNGKKLIWKKLIWKHSKRLRFL